MPYLLEDLIVDRVDLVDEGANSAAFIELYKRKERSETMGLQDIIAKMTPEHAEVVQAELTKLTDEVTKTKEDLVEATTERDDALAKAQEELDAANDELAAANSELDTLKAGSTAFDEEETLKSMPEGARELFSKMKAQKEAAEEAVRKAKEAEAQAEAVAKAAELKALPIEHDKLVGVLKGASTELIEMLTAINAAVDTTVLGEIGKSNAGSNASSSTAAWGKIETKAAEIAKTGGVSKAKAIAMAVDQNPDLYKEYLEGGAN